MNIVYSADRRYALPCAVSIASVLHHNSPQDCFFYIMTSDLDDKSLERFKLIEQNFHTHIQIIEVTELHIPSNVLTERYPISIFYRYLIPELLPHEQKAIYLDCDILVVDSLDELWNINIDGYACGMCEDQNSDDVLIQNRVLQEPPYYNSGVMLFNLYYWRENHIRDLLLEYINKFSERLRCPDQDAINVQLRGKILPLAYRYNVQEEWFYAQHDMRILYSKWDDVNNAKKSPTIIHYTGLYKPWHERCGHPLRKLFFQYKKMIGDYSPPINVVLDGDPASYYYKKYKKYRKIYKVSTYCLIIIISVIAVLIYLLLK